MAITQVTPILLVDGFEGVTYELSPNLGDGRDQAAAI
jgi:hypothetical protein